MPRIDRRNRQPAIGERAHQRELIFLFRTSAMEKDDDGTSIFCRHRFQKNARHALASFGCERKSLGGVEARVRTGAGLRRKRHAWAVDELEKRGAYARRVNRLGAHRDEEGNAHELR